ncbi:MAG: hypothetical protein ACK5N8_01495 [Alphaproteobacteria bacterium]
MVAILLLLSLFSINSAYAYYVDSFRLYYYILAVGVLLYCVSRQFFGFSILALLLFIVSFFILESSANIFNNVSYDSENKVSVLYGRKVTNKTKFIEHFQNRANFISVSGKRNEFVSIDRDFLKKGIVGLSPHYKADFMLSQLSDKGVMFIAVDFSGISLDEVEIVFNNLAQFVNLQGCPIVILGDFGIPVWTTPFKNFLDKTHLEVKNRIIWGGNKYFFNPFAVPTINVLGYKEMGLNKIKFLSKEAAELSPILFDLSY